MRTANDGLGEEPWDDPAAASSPDDEATRIFSREAFSLASAASDADTTREFARETPDETTRAFRREESAEVSGTREFTRSDPDFDGLYEVPAGSEGEWAPGRKAEEAGPSSVDFTRRFVRERPPGRGRVPRSMEREPKETPPTAEPRGRRTSPPRPRRPRRRFRLRWAITLVLLIVLALPPATWGWVWYTARQDDRTASDAIIVLGASQYNGVPSPVFEARLRQAQELYLEGVAPVIITVGGKQPGDNFTEAASGRNWLIEVGVPSEQIIAVEEGSDTLQSIQAVSLVFEERSWETAILVSDPWHSLRSKRMAADHGIEAGTSPSRSGPAVIERRTQVWYITRETASLWYYWIFNNSSDIQVNAA